MTGLRVELAIGAPSGCPVTKTTARAETAAREITWSTAGDRTVEQFTAQAGHVDPPGNVEAVFQYDDEGVYQFDQQSGALCPCKQIERDGYPVNDVRAEGGTLYVTLHLDGRDALSDVLNSLREDFSEISIRTIAQAETGTHQQPEFVPINRGELTDRQQEVLQTALDMGYFEYPRQANASDVADELGICPSTLAEHMAAAQSKLLSGLLENGTTEAE